MLCLSIKEFESMVNNLPQKTNLQVLMVLLWNLNKHLRKKLHQYKHFQELEGEGTLSILIYEASIN